MVDAHSNWVSLIQKNATNRALAVLMKRESTLVVAIQNVAEFWNVATRPTVNNGLGFTIEEVQE